MAVLAGFVATLEMGLGTNAVVYLFSLLGLREPERELVELATLGADRFFDGDLLKFAVALTALLFVGGCGWAILYTHVIEPLLPWPSWLSGLAFGIGPWLLSMFVLLPVFGGGVLGLALDAGPIPLIGEALRTGLFGLGLGTSYALLYAARQPPSRVVAADPSEPNREPSEPSA
jgi:hypothetical protein